MASGRAVTRQLCQLGRVIVGVQLPSVALALGANVQIERVRLQTGLRHILVRVGCQKLNVSSSPTPSVFMMLETPPANIQLLGNYMAST